MCNLVILGLRSGNWEFLGVFLCVSHPVLVFELDETRVLSMSNITGFRSPTELEQQRYSIWGNADGFTLFQVPPYTHIIFKCVVGDSQQPFIQNSRMLTKIDEMQRDPNLPAAIFPILSQDQ